MSDEAAAKLESLPKALRRGHAGATHQNCQGVFKRVASACLRAQRRRQALRPVFNNLGRASAERDGQHYFAGLSLLSPTEQQVLTAHGDLYPTGVQGRPTLRIEEGSVSSQSVTPSCEIGVEQFSVYSCQENDHVLPADQV